MRKFWPYAVPVVLGVALALGAYLYAKAPGGMLHYTPAPNYPAHYTPSFQIGFLVAAIVQIALYALVSIAALLFRWREIMHKSLSLLAVSVFVFLCSLLPERWWALTLHSSRPPQAASAQFERWRSL
jgi:phosphoglycerol transferase MdoB-like AlkP superfamily enzyme